MSPRDSAFSRNRARWARHVRHLRAKERCPLVRRALSLMREDGDVGSWIAPGEGVCADPERVRAYETAADIVWLRGSDARERLRQLDLLHLL